MSVFKAAFRIHSLLTFCYMARRVQEKGFNFEHIVFLKSDLLFKKQNTRNSSWTHSSPSLV